MEGMSSTHQINQMKIFTSIAAAAAVISASFIATRPGEAGTVNVSRPSQYSYEDSSVRQLKIRGKYGRYITFVGRSTNSWQGTNGNYNPGSQGYVQCNSIGYSTTCNRIGYVAPSYTPGRSGGSSNRHYRYELDCKDGTFDRKGDRARGIRKKGWMSVMEDPTALAVARKYCPMISTLPK